MYLGGVGHSIEKAKYVLQLYPFFGVHGIIRTAQIQNKEFSHYSFCNAMKFHSPDSGNFIKRPPVVDGRCVRYSPGTNPEPRLFPRGRPFPKIIRMLLAIQKQIREKCVEKRLRP